MQPIISIKNLSKTYASGHKALDDVSLDIHSGEIIALLGPNGAGKTTLISIICGLVNISSGQVLIGGKDNVSDFREARELIGLVPQELHLSLFEKVWNTIAFSRGLFGKPQNNDYLNKLLKDLSLYDKKDSLILTLSGGMKRRVLIAKALAHEPKILFLDEPTAGVDVELRKDMWRLLKEYKNNGYTIILTTHYIEEAEGMADRVGVINKGKLILVEEKSKLMEKLGKQSLSIILDSPIESIPDALGAFQTDLSEDGKKINYYYNAKAENKMNAFLKAVSQSVLPVKDIKTTQSSLEDIFVDLVKK